ncbi:hypothetical protein MF672_040540 [Actinomadura sp. ATCC 31491]|uniref:Uncharacterized protein n=1 Tax=Actinomadura luzonensis TaxID=2805427 RepID=A0ABT0G641_9ACTN|nr:hypothetical protein [Actinomadura luzonensis]MCK2220042.1 hypothetical protein [Actinomadura luzonensis]
MRPAAAVLAAVLLPVLAGCGSPVDEAAARTRVEAERIGRVMTLVNARRSAADYARTAENERGPYDLRVRALAARGDKFEGGAVVVLQITVTGTFSGRFGGKGATVSATRCYRYTIENRTDDDEPEEVACRR